jgi:hypothetical protein
MRGIPGTGLELLHLLVFAGLALNDTFFVIFKYET